MKKTILLLSLWVFSLLVSAQVVSTTPAFINENTGTVEIVFDATQGTGGLAGYTGDVYVHTGIITSASVNESDWKYVQSEWGQNLPKLKLTSLGNDKYKLVISPSIQAFYGVPAGEKVEKLALVFRSGAEVPSTTPGGKPYYKEGKDLVSGAAKDIFINVYDASALNMVFVSPSGNQSVKKNTSLNFIVNTSTAANIDLLVNNSVVNSVTNAEQLNYNYTFTATGDFEVVAKASTATKTVYDTIFVCVPKTAPLGTRPSGVKDGINYGTNEVTLVLYAPNKKNVFLVGDFNDFVVKNDYQMKKDGNYWFYTLTDVNPNKQYRFQYVVDDSIRISDPYTELVLDPWSDDWINTADNTRYPYMPKYPTGKASGTVSVFQINKSQYAWQATNYTMPNKTSMVIYELLLRDFTTKQSLQGALDRIDYLANLGVTAIELMPIQEFDGNSSWGYNPNHYFAPDKAYGSPILYKKFIDECHKRGIAVILDVVLNHASGTHPFAKLWWNSAANKTAADNPYFNVTAPHPFSVMHDFNHSKTIVRDHFKRMLKYWIEEYHIDGYRLDLSKGFTQRPCGDNDNCTKAYDQDRINYLKEYYGAAKSKKEDIMFILEHFCDDSEENALAGEGMYMWKSIYNEHFSQSAMGYQENSGFDGIAEQFPRNWVHYPESHDHERNFYKAKAYGAGTMRTDSILRVSRVPLNMAFATLLPGPKMIWQFGEIGYDVKFGDDGSDERMEEKPSGFLWFDKFEHRQQAYYKTAKIINLKKQFPLAFAEGYCESQVAQSDWTNGRRIAIKHSDLNLVVIGNFRTDASSGFPSFPKTGTWYELMSETTLNVTNTNMEIPLQGGEVKVFVDRQVTLPEMPNIINGTANVQTTPNVILYPNPTADKVYILSETAVKSVSVYTLSGLLVKQYNNVNEIDLSNVSNGFYLIETLTADGKTIHKIIKN
ncbi:MAG: T9SS type A sorting domain-containing protein [Prevotellaceae bacterium]|nr:T9SS type A sorting domain-containing protein [Prevotellaceae bacterium]